MKYARFAAVLAVSATFIVFAIDAPAALSLFGLSTVGFTQETGRMIALLLGITLVLMIYKWRKRK